jgi:hypothetical protein
MTQHNETIPAPTQRHSALGLPFLALIGLAALGVPRVILHDLHVIDEGDPLTWVLAIGPVAVWVLVAILAKAPKPFLTVLVTGILFGAMLAATHQLLWDNAFGGDLPAVFGSTIVPRLAAIPSGLFTGALLGAIGGLIAWAIRSAARRSGSA